MAFLSPSVHGARFSLAPGQNFLRREACSLRPSPMALGRPAVSSSLRSDFLCSMANSPQPPARIPASARAGARPSAISMPELVLQVAPWRSASPPCPSAIGSPSSFNLAVGLVSVQAAIAPCQLSIFDPRLDVILPCNACLVLDKTPKSGPSSFSRSSSWFRYASWSRDAKVKSQVFPKRMQRVDISARRCHQSGQPEDG
ncbi:uncharacterized protein [Zea mays]|uniref:uncharacterized protein n=1 Tax=Zea mays TaxID=4577 RepID=UPI0004DEC314|nr:uncharacterized protein LOC103640825 [Zea mays]|eukprot:XP_008662515.1 uncharacterized protein LOC103640825 [Zea mays]